MINIPTPITSLDRVSFVGSPLHIEASVDIFSYFEPITLKLWIWSGGLTDPYVNDNPPTRVFQKEPISFFLSVRAEYPVLFEVGDIINSYINPEILVGFVTFNVSGEGVYYQYELVSDHASYNSPTYFAVGGYNWNYEGQTPFTYNRGSFGFQALNVEKNYSPYISYFDRQIELSGATSSDTMIKSVPATYDSYNVVCSSDQYMFVYINKYGLFDTFTPSGMVVVSSKIDRETYNRAYSNPKALNPVTGHQTNNYNINAVQSYVINTGLLSQDMGMLVEELLLSKKVYLIQFKGDKGHWLTADNTFISCDTTLFSCDATYEEGTENYITFRQIPVVMVDTDFGRKTRLNDKAKISYNIKVDEASQKILNIR